MNLQINHPNLIPVENSNDPLVSLRLSGNEFEGIIIRYGRVAFEDTGDAKFPVKLHWEYQIVSVPEGMSYDEEKLKRTLFQYLLELIDQQLKSNSIVYTNGVDENRNNNSE